VQKLPIITVVTVVALFATSCASSTSIKRLNITRSPPNGSDRLRLFGQFVGDWNVDSVIIQQGDVRIRNKGEWHFRWILDGTAVQDVFQLHDVDGNRGSPPSSYGTTVRVYDSQKDLWHVAYVSGTAHSIRRFEARRVGDEIVMDSADSGPRYRWVFSQIHEDSFHWRSEGSPDNGTTWIANQEMTVRRQR
jgi:hypothetical protein